MKIRKAAPSDLDGIETLYDRTHDCEEAGKLSVGWIRGIYPTRKTAEDALARGDLFVLEDRGILRAAAVINRLQVPEYRFVRWQYAADADHVMVLHTLVVDPCMYGKGLGTAFVRFYEEYAAKNGCEELRMDTNIKNTAARALYKKLGYTESDTVPCTFNGIPGVTLVCLEKSPAE